MTHALAFRSIAIRRKREPDPGAGAIVFFSLVAASGFAVGWAAQFVGSF
jgi:hypothetical protein